MSGYVLTATGKMGLKISVTLVIIGAETIAMEVVERSMDRAVIFDLYETLITENHPEWHAEAPTPGERLGLSQEDFDREWFARYQARMTGKFQCYRDVLREICCACQIAPPEEEISTMQAERLAAKARPFERLDPLVVETLYKLKASGYRIGVISNCAFDEMAAWDSTELAVQVDVPIFSCVEGLTKPNPAIYELACERLGVDNSAAVYVGDGGSDELRGADTAGLTAIWTTWYIEKWPWDWVGYAAKTSDGFPQCRRFCDLPALVDDMYT